MRIGLGTAQFGMPYGISNQKGKISVGEAHAIFAAAAANGINLIDTAAAYGDSEAALGHHLRRFGEHFKVVTKTMPLSHIGDATDAPRFVRESFIRSLERLGLERVEGLLVHHANDLLGPKGGQIWDVLQDLRTKGLVARTGVSAYTGADIDAVLERFNIDLIQVPVNILDQRLLRGGQLSRLAARGVEVHVRSVFLQGLLLMDPERLPTYFNPIRQRLTELRHALTERNLTATQGALAFARTLPVAVVLVGVESADQLNNNIVDFISARTNGLDFARFAIDDESYVNPSRWNLAA